MNVPATPSFLLAQAVITMSTIGYGDISPSTDLGKAVAICYLPLAVIALADAVSDVQMIGTRRSIRETDFSKLIDECLLRDAIREDPTQPNIEPVLTEGEFLVDQVGVMHGHNAHTLLAQRATVGAYNLKALTQIPVFCAHLAILGTFSSCLPTSSSMRRPLLPYNASSSTYAGRVTLSPTMTVGSPPNFATRRYVC